MSELDDLANDNTSGASSIADRLLTLLEALIVDYPGEDSDLISAVAATVDRAIAAQPIMASLRTRGMRIIAAAGSSYPGDVRSATLAEIRRIRSEGEEDMRRLAGYGAAIVFRGATVATISASSAVKSIILTASGAIDRVLLIESRPMREGVPFARDLACAGIRCELYVDAAIGEIVRRSTIALIGADTVTPTMLYNKTGTHALAVICAHHGVPLYAAFTEDRVINEEIDTAIPSHPADEIAPEAADTPGLTVVNRYFEPIPRALVSGFVTENGIFSP